MSFQTIYSINYEKIKGSIAKMLLTVSSPINVLQIVVCPYAYGYGRIGKPGL
jgi:hypothetical protein